MHGLEHEDKQCINLSRESTAMTSILAEKVRVADTAGNDLAARRILAVQQMTPAAEFEAKKWTDTSVDRM